MNDHFEAAVGQLQLADDLAQSREQMWLNAQVAARVHAQLALAVSIREAALDVARPEWEQAVVEPF